jgi:hypothetical protein
LDSSVNVGGIGEIEIVAIPLPEGKDLLKIAAPWVRIRAKMERLAMGTTNLLTLR